MAKVNKIKKNPDWDPQEDPGTALGATGKGGKAQERG